MKYLTHYLEDKQNKLFEELKCFFAFSNKQFEEGEAKYPEVKKWIHIRNVGMFVPKENAEAFLERHSKLVDEAIKQDLEENGKKAIIHRELGNYEYCITYRIDDVVGALSGYDITEDEIMAETKPYLKAYYEWEAKQEESA